MYRILLFLLVFSNCNPKEKKPNDLTDVDFPKFLRNFKVKELPLIIERDSLFSLKKQIYDTAKLAHVNNIYPRLDQEYKIFLPVRLRGELANIRCIYRFKTNFGVSVIVADDTITEGDQSALKLFLINYSNLGDILDFLEIAGYSIDVSEAFVTIDKKNSIDRVNYLFKQCLDIDQGKYTCAQERKTIFEMNKKGEIIKVNEEIRDGAFEGDERGYHFIK